MERFGLTRLYCIIRDKCVEIRNVKRKLFVPKGHRKYLRNKNVDYFNIRSFCIFLTFTFYFRMLSSLALTSQFLRKLWTIITNKEQQALFGNAATYINIISRGIELPPNDIELIIPQCTTFCSLLMLLIATLHDNEFYNDDPSKNICICRVMCQISTKSIHFYYYFFFPWLL